MSLAKKTDMAIAVALVALVAALVVWFRSVDLDAGATTTESDAAGITYADYDGKVIGVLSGTNMEDASKQFFPNSELLYFDGYPDLNAALEAGMIDAYLGDEPALKSIHAQQPQIDFIKERLTENEYSFAFRKDDPHELVLRNDFNTFLAELHADGTYDEIDATWFGTDEEKKVVPMDDLTGERGTIHIATTSTDEPFCYIKDGKHVGFDIDVTARFCRSRGYALDILDVDYPARIPALQSGQVEFTTTMNVTPEREEVVLFSDPVSTGGIVCAVRAADLGADVSTQPAGGLFDRIAESFERNFIREGRWKLIVRGLGTTCLITCCSIAAGALVAFGVCLLRRTGSRLANLVCDVYVRLLQGTPTVVLLMILYYVFLGRAGVPALWVAVLGFTLNFGAYGSEIMRAAIDGIGGGQREAALSLGYSEGQAFFDFIFPQAAVRFLPVLAGEAVNLLKSTSVVGYIAVQDLTKMSDIIRSRTYEAFFPLMVTAALYFVLAWVIARAARVLARRIEPRNRARRHAQSESDAPSGKGRHEPHSGLAPVQGLRRGRRSPEGRDLHR